MTEQSNNVVDARQQEALAQYFNGVSLSKTIGDCAVLAAIRKQNSAPVDIYTPSFEVARDDTARSAIAKEFETFVKIGSQRLQATERHLTSRAFKKFPALALLSCPVSVFDEAFDTRSVETKLQVFDEVLEGLAALHSAEIVHGNLSPDAIRRENPDGALRLCDFGFSGGRTTKITAQPAAYQSRHIINSSQPRFDDDIHAAGMLGYRILLGRFGAERVLTGTAEETDDQLLISSILGEGTTAPEAKTLFPESHPSGEQIARLLARMTGRLENATAYSSAVAALKAYRSVLDNPTLTSFAEPVRTSNAPSPDNAMAAAVMRPPSQVEGISKATALALFGGFLISTGAAVYFYMQHSTSEANLRLAMGSRAALSEQIEQQTADFEAYKTGSAAIRDADRHFIEARLKGADRASQSSREAFETASAFLNEADAGLDGSDSEIAIKAAGQSKSFAADAISALEHAREMAANARDQAVSTRVAAEVAGVAEAEDFAAALAQQEHAEAELAEGMFEKAAKSFLTSSANLQDLIDQMRTAAETARTAALEAKSDAKAVSETAGFIRAEGLLRRATTAMEASGYSDASQFFAAARTAFQDAYVPEAAGAASPEDRSREITLGDDENALTAAIQLCLDHAPIADSNCPGSRPENEMQRSADVTPFEIDATEVSAGDFARFVDETGYATEAESDVRLIALTSSGEARFIDGGYTWFAPGGRSTSYRDNPQLPVTNVSVKDAAAYCAWASGRLPTEAEWEISARAWQSASFPWGEWPSETLVWRGADKASLRLPQPVDAAGAETRDGHVGFAGNAREWVIATDGAVLKGGSWNTANPADLRVSARLTVPGNAPGVDFGFRCARDLEDWK